MVFSRLMVIFDIRECRSYNTKKLFLKNLVRVKKHPS